MKTREELLARGEGVATAMSLEKVRELRGRVEDYMKKSRECLDFWGRSGRFVMLKQPTEAELDRPGPLERVFYICQGKRVGRYTACTPVREAVMARGSLCGSFSSGKGTPLFCAYNC